MENWPGTTAAPPVWGRSKAGSAETAEALRLRQGLEPLQRVVLDLADPLAGDTKGLTHLLEGHRPAPIEPVAQLQHLPIPLRQRGQRLLHVLALQVPGS